MSHDVLKQKRSERLTEWVTGGSYAVAVEVDAIVYPDRPAEPYFSPETVRHLETVKKLAEAGNEEALKKVGTVYVRLKEQSGLVAAGIGNHGADQGCGTARGNDDGHA